jgi:hypothetical protein
MGYWIQDPESRDGIEHSARRRVKTPHRTGSVRHGLDRRQEGAELRHEAIEALELEPVQWPAVPATVVGAEQPARWTFPGCDDSFHLGPDLLQPGEEAIVLERMTYELTAGR